MKLSLLFPLAIILSSCVQGTLSDTISVNESLSFALPSAASDIVLTCEDSTTFDTTQSTSFDVSDALSHLKDQGTLSVAFTENSITGDLTGFQHARIMINNDGQPQQLLSDTDFASVNGKVSLPILLDNNTLVDILSAGKTYLTVDLSTCVPSSAVSISYTMTANVSLDVHKGI
jgi:hypothetical protein